jgi:hypothetical protein
MAGADCRLFVMSPAGGGKGVDVFEVAVMFTSYILALLSPPPSLRDTSASGGHEMAKYLLFFNRHSNTPAVGNCLSQAPVFFTAHIK